MASSEALEFNLIPDIGTPSFVVEAFQHAAGEWASHLYDDQSIDIEIGFASMGFEAIGQTRIELVSRDYSSVRSALWNGATSYRDHHAYARLQPGPSISHLVNLTVDSPYGQGSPTPYLHESTRLSLTHANAKVLGLGPIDGAVDASIRFNSDVNFDFDASDGVSAGHFDFQTMAVHELGHALGFYSVVDLLDRSGGALETVEVIPTVLDLFRFSSDSLNAGDGVFDASADRRDKFLSVDGGVSSVAELATGVVNGSGYQASHWKEFGWTGMMDATLFAGNARSIKSADLAALDVIGYRIVPEPGTGALVGLGLIALLARWRGRYGGGGPRVGSLNRG